jgi:hypothetical protein
MKRRTFLSMTSGAIASLGLGACTRKKAATTVPARKIARRMCGALGRTDAPKPTLVAELRRRFRELDCMTMTLVATNTTRGSLVDDVDKYTLELHGLLSYQPYSREIAEAWRRFYGLTARLHEIRNRRAQSADIPVYAYNGHQHAARLWIDEHARRGPRGPLLHFDSHPDMRSLVRAEEIVEATHELDGGGADRKKALTQLRALINDHATPVSAGILGGAVEELVWAAPSWAAIRPITRRPLLYADVAYGAQGRRFELFHDSSADPAGALPKTGPRPWYDIDRLTKQQRRTLERQRPFHMSIVETYPRGKRASGQLTELIPAGRFILDIDLDYLLTVDTSSGFERPRRDLLDREAGRRLYVQHLRIARQLVDDRLARLATLLGRLRRAGRVPSMVTLADSTYRPFSPFVAGKGYWEYMPYEFAAYAHWRMRRILARVYGDDGIAAGV